MSKLVRKPPDTEHYERVCGLFGWPGGGRPVIASSNEPASCIQGEHAD